MSRLTLDTGHLNKVMTSLKGSSSPSKGKPSVGLERRIAALESQFLSNRDVITRELLQFSCPAYSRSSLGSEVCQISRRQEATDRQVASLRQLIARGGGGGGTSGGGGAGGGGGGGVNSVPAVPARTTPSPPLDDRINILQNGKTMLPSYKQFSQNQNDTNFSPGASDGFCVSTESFTARQSKIEFEEVMFSKGNMFSIKENDFQVRACQT